MTVYASCKTSDPVVTVLYRKNKKSEYEPCLEATVTLKCSSFSRSFYRIQHFDIEASKNCVFDSLRAWRDDSFQETSTIFGPTCGENAPEVDVTQSWTATNTSLVVVEFQTDSDVSFTGFRLAFEQSR